MRWMWRLEVVCRGPCHVLRPLLSRLEKAWRYSTVQAPIISRPVHRPAQPDPTAITVPEAIRHQPELESTLSRHSRTTKVKAHVDARLIKYGAC